MIELELLPPGSILCRVHIGNTPAGGYPCSFVTCPAEDGLQAMVLGMSGRMKRHDWRDFLQMLVDMRIKTLVTKRVDGHGVPLGITGDDGLTRNEVAELVQRFQRPDANTDMAPL